MFKGFAVNVIFSAAYTFSGIKWKIELNLTFYQPKRDNPERAVFTFVRSNYLSSRINQSAFHA
ncbi:hypothetical protein IMPR6_20021 [Imperialibacter sp. EC-SDR9]|nr:hypothetical protein IMPERIA75_420267 [Imperialibacter sp. 75]CAD5295896.1 hypothetical protein IMPERIA89_660265 [Imperialibacter sp. 89]VVT11679.1 hypothetical protein IMPR6_20021 [Imperialibacter sp. EC-SDR9]